MKKLILLILALSAAPARAEPELIILGDLEKNHIQGLELSTGTLEVEEIVRGEDFQTLAILTGKFEREDASLVLTVEAWKTVIKPSAERFRIQVPMTGDSAILDFTMIDGYGNMEKLQASISFADWKQYIDRRRRRRDERFHYSAGANLTFLSFHQTNKPDYGMTAITGKAGISRRTLNDRLDLLGNVFFTLLPLTKSSNVTARFLGVNVRAGYPVPWLSEPWRVTLFGGIYYSTMFVSGNAFGFRNLAGPQFFPSVRRLLRTGDTIVAYLKVSPMTDGVVPLALRNRELAAGGAYLHSLKNGRTVNATIDVASFVVHISRSKIQSSSVSVGASYGF